MRWQRSEKRPETSERQPTAHTHSNDTSSHPSGYGCDFETADRICCFNRHYAEHSGYFLMKTKWLDTVDKNVETTYVSNRLVFLSLPNRLRVSYIRRECPARCHFEDLYHEHGIARRKNVNVNRPPFFSAGLTAQHARKPAPRSQYDSVTGKPLFVAPRGRTFAEFLKESRAHGWPSFRDEEVVWENMRCLSNGEAVSVDGYVTDEPR